MKCPKCNSDVEMMLDVTMLIPSELEGRLTKKSLRKKDVKLYAANWGRASYFCKNEKCQWRLFPPMFNHRDIKKNTFDNRIRSEE
jgi:hypothetical protein